MRLLLRSILHILLAVSLGATSALAQAPSPEGPPPVAVVESLHGALLDGMKGEFGPTFENRRARILAVLDETFDLPFMARMSLGKAWKTLGADQREAFFAAQRMLSASNYASNFDSWGGQSFETLGDKPAARNTILVQTELILLDDDDVRFDYRLRQTAGRWRVIDVTLDGKVSEITLRRADYTSFLERNGFDSLLAEIQRKIAKLEVE